MLDDRQKNDKISSKDTPNYWRKIVLQLISVFSSDPIYTKKENVEIDSKPSLRLNRDELNEHITNFKTCPDCHSDSLYEGPSAGLSLNVVCGNCGSFFNLQGPFGVDRIHDFKIDYNADNYYEISPLIVNNWYPVCVNINDPAIIREIYDLCRDSCQKGWSVKFGKKQAAESFDTVGIFDAVTFYFQNKDDVLKFKLSVPYDV